MFFHHSGILGINARNLLYIRPYNKKKAIRLADNKLQTKHFLSARGIPVPKLYCTIRDHRQLKKFDFNQLPETFVLKPNLGFGGEGIIPIIGREGEVFTKIGGYTFTTKDFYDRVNDILDGRYSLSGLQDTAFFEQLILCDESISPFSYGGLPDIRIVVHNLIPVMAMLRLPTKESQGLANLHQGAIGVGIDIARGEPTHIVQGSKIIHEIPGVEEDIRTLKIPYWDEMLLIASRVQLITNLGYMAVDMAVDKQHGPVLLEINARAGLGVQIANLAPLRRRLERIHGIKVGSPEKGLRIARELFAHKVEKESVQLVDKTIIGTEEEVELLVRDGTVLVNARIDPSRDVSILDQSLALEIDANPELLEKHQMKAKYILAGVRVQTLLELKDFSHDSFKMIIGARDLNSFLIDPRKKSKKALKNKSIDVASSYTPHFYHTEIDKKIIDIDKQLKLLHHLQPLNLDQEKTYFFQDRSYDPQFIYPDLSFDSYVLRELLSEIRTDESPLGIIYEHKLQEILQKMKLLEAIGTERFTEHSEELFGAVDAKFFDQAFEFHRLYPLDVDIGDTDLIDQNVIRNELTMYLKNRGLDHWKLREKANLVSRMLAGKRNTLFIRRNLNISRTRLRALIAHEIETHVFTAENGKFQPYMIFNRGFARYLKTQEGLAIYHQFRVVGRESRIAHLVMAISFARQKSFSGVFEDLKDLGLSDERAFFICAKVKRGLEDTSLKGVFTKDLCYLKGFFEVEAWLENGGDPRKLFVGKISLEDIHLLEKIPNIKPPRYLPDWVTVL